MARIGWASWEGLAGLPRPAGRSWEGLVGLLGKDWLGRVGEVGLGGQEGCDNQRSFAYSGVQRSFSNTLLGLWWTSHCLEIDFVSKRLVSVISG